MIIFSVEQAGLSERENMYAQIEATELLSQGPYAVMHGVYLSKEEPSFITPQVEVGRRLAQDFNQECYFERGHYGVWYLIDTMTGDIIDTFKTIKEVSREVAEASENYSILDGKYYIASKY